MKYIIKNCPNYWYINRAIPECGLTYKVSGFKGETETCEYCKDITDCLLKQIVEKCKKVDCDCLINKRNCSAMDNMSMCCELFVKKDILRLLEIEKVNEQLSKD